MRAVTKQQQQQQLRRQAQRAAAGAAAETGPTAGAPAQQQQQQHLYQTSQSHRCSQLWCLQGLLLCCCCPGLSHFATFATAYPLSLASLWLCRGSFNDQCCRIACRLPFFAAWPTASMVHCTRASTPCHPCHLLSQDLPLPLCRRGALHHHAKQIPYPAANFARSAARSIPWRLRSFAVIVAQSGCENRGCPRLVP